MTKFLIKLFIKDRDNINNSAVRTKYGTLSSIVGISVNVILAAIKMLAGLISGSVAILADGINNLSDAGSSGVTFISFKIASKPADREHPFGHARIEYVASLIVSFLILHIGLDLFIDSSKTILGLSDFGAVVISWLTLAILIISILMKLWLGMFYITISKKIDSTVLRANAMDSFMDCISTAAVLICSIVIRFTGWIIIDSIVGLGVSALILIAGIKILIETKNSILGEAPVDETVKAIENIVSEYPEIVGIHDMMIHNYGPSNFIASFHAEVNGNEDIYMLHDIIDNVEKRITIDLGIQCTIHMDPIVTDDEMTNKLKAIVIAAAKKIDENITIHDFRAVIGPTHTNLIFDLVLPFENKMPKEQVCEILEGYVKSEDYKCFCVITVDRG